MLHYTFNSIKVELQAALLRIREEILPRALCGRRSGGERPTGLHHHVMKGEESSQYYVPLFPQCRQGRSARNDLTLQGLVLVQVRSINPSAQKT